MQQSDLGLNLSTKKTRKREFLEQMQQVVPWKDLAALIAPYAPEGRPPFPVEMLLRIHFMQQWFTLKDPAMEEALHNVPLFRDFVGLSWDSSTPDESTILRFRHLLEKHKLAEQILKTVTDLLVSKKLLPRTGTIVDATFIAAPSSTKNSNKSRDPKMHQAKKGNQWYFGMKAHIGVDADSGLVHTVRGTAANVSDVVEANSLLHGQESLRLRACQAEHASGQRNYIRTKVTTTGAAVPISGGGASPAGLRDEELRAAKNWVGIAGSLREHTDGLLTLASYESSLKSAWTSTKRY